MACFTHIPAALLSLALLALAPAWAGNTPCSGAKGGIERCQGERFLCRDGSILSLIHI